MSTKTYLVRTTAMNHVPVFKAGTEALDRVIIPKVEKPAGI